MAESAATIDYNLTRLPDKYVYDVWCKTDASEVEFGLEDDRFLFRMPQSVLANDRCLGEIRQLKLPKTAANQLELMKVERNKGGFKITVPVRPVH